MLEGLHAIRRQNRLPPSKHPENLEESVVLRRRNGAAPLSDFQIFRFSDRRTAACEAARGGGATPAPRGTCGAALEAPHDRRGRALRSLDDRALVLPSAERAERAGASSRAA